MENPVDSLPQRHYANDPLDLGNQIPYLSISETAPPSLPVEQKPQKKIGYTCQFLGHNCAFMMVRADGAFKNVAELKEDVLRHLNAYQCKECGKRFGKRYGLSRHTTRQGLGSCMQKGGNDAVVWVSPELEVAVLALENAKGYENLTVAIAKCKQFYECADLREVQA